MTIKFPNALKNNILLKMIFFSEIYKKDENIIKDLAHNVDEMIILNIKPTKYLPISIDFHTEISKDNLSAI